jgi:hypothetical protein
MYGLYFFAKRMDNTFVSQVAFMQMETTGLAKENFEELWIDPL